MAYPMFPLVSAPASYMPVPVDLVQRLARSPWPTPGSREPYRRRDQASEPACGSYGYESEAVDAWLDELAEKLGKRELF